MWSGDSSNIPSGWALCNGQNGTPDLRNRFVVGAGSSYSIGATGGSDFVTLSESELPSHNHSLDTYAILQVDNTDSGLSNGMYTDKLTAGQNYDRIVKTYYTNNTGYNQAHENRPPYYALCYIMKL